MKMIKKLFCITGLLFLSGCGSQWVKKSNNAEDYLDARTHCEDRAEELFPTKNEVAKDTTRTLVYDGACVKNGKKDKKKKCRNYYHSDTRSYVLDVNYDSRNEIFNSCMERKGWEERTTLF